MPGNRVPEKQKGEPSVFDVCRARLKPWDLGVNFSWFIVGRPLLPFKRTLFQLIS